MADLANSVKHCAKRFPGIRAIMRSLGKNTRTGRWLFLKPEKPIASFRRYCENISRKIPRPVFIKVGANDGITGDPCSDIILSHTNWTGILVEPVPYCFENLQANFPDRSRFILEQVAIGGKAGSSTFYYVDQDAKKYIPGLPRWYDQLGSFYRSHIVKHLDGALEPFIIETDIEIYPLPALIEKHSVNVLHLLHVDTEGYDFEVLKTLDFNHCAPVLIFIEHAHLDMQDKQDMRRLLAGHGYSILDCGSDFFALNKKAYRKL